MDGYKIIKKTEQTIENETETVARYFNSNCKTFRNDFETPWAKEIANRPVKYPIVFRKSEKAREREGAKEGVKERRGKKFIGNFRSRS